MAKKNVNKINKDIDKKNKNNILNKTKGKNVLINIFYVLISVFVYFLILMKGYINIEGEDVSSFENILYSIIYGFRFIFGDAVYVFLLLAISINSYIVFNRNKIRKVYIGRKIILIVFFLSYSLMLTSGGIGPLSNNFSDAISELIGYTFEFRGGGAIGSVLAIPFYRIIRALPTFLILLLLTLSSLCLFLSKYIRLLYKTILNTLEYYNSEDYKKKKEVLRLKIEYERKKQEEIDLKREREFSQQFIKLKDEKLNKEISKKLDMDKSDDKEDFYTPSELERKKKEWIEYCERIDKQEKEEKEKREEQARILRELEIERQEKVKQEELARDNNLSEEKIEEYNFENKYYEELHDKYVNNLEEEFKLEQMDVEPEELTILEEESVLDQDLNSIDNEELNRSVEEVFKYKQMDPEKKEEMKREIDSNITLLETVLSNFGIDAKVVDYGTGPTITRYEIKIPQDVKVKKVTELENEIKMYLKAESIRIEAPIPGKDAIGIETPNKIKEPVYFSNIIHSDALNEGILPVVLGKDIVGKNRVIDITKLPHLLIAGTTGSGKSIAINTMISSLISKKSDDEVKFIMVDPKMVELTLYDGIAHLLTPVITDPNMASVALKWAVNEMEDRYRKLASFRMRNIEGYNKEFKNDKMPYIVIVIDELADLMMVASNDVEKSIARIAQKARAVGIHLIVATQRPSADVVTGIIKANLPSRISFALRSSIDSRTILDQVGADKLLGKGDMLFLDNGKAKLERLQGAFISDDEVKQLTDIIKSSKKAVYNENVLASVDENDDDRDPYLDQAIEIASRMTRDEKLSISYLQRELRVGFNRASRIFEQLKKNSIIDSSNRYIGGDNNY
jgi:DNA segregation ATPase FtsK/SpoIIIE and related proteins